MASYVALEIARGSGQLRETFSLLANMMMMRDKIGDSAAAFVNLRMGSISAFRM